VLSTNLLKDTSTKGIKQEERTPSHSLPNEERFSRECTLLMRFYDSATSNARGANSGPLMGSVDDQPDALKIRVPAPLGDIICMANIIPESRGLATNLTSSCHVSLLIHIIKRQTIADFICLRQTASTSHADSRNRNLL
jgi:hypothetical protein